MTLQPLGSEGRPSLEPGYLIAERKNEVGATVLSLVK
jgi:hypothetical protein